MILDKKVLMQIKTATYDNEGVEVAVWTANQTYININIQTNNKSQVYVKEHAKSTASYEFIMFANVNTDIVVGARIVDGSDSYDIMRVLPWPNHYELICASTQR